MAGRYRMVALLGKGGMGDVYRAEDLKLGQTVALKFLPENVAGSDAARARFHREVRLARQVSHPNVCRVFDVGEAEGRTFLTMEYVDGEDLAFLLRRIGRLPPDKALEIARQICSGLAAAHEHGIIHRDLKPANIMLDGRGHVRITDFGLAGAATEFLPEEAGAGTPAYMSPEQFESREATPRSDLYALGLVLYEIFTGKQAFEAPTYLEIVRLREKSAPTFPSQLAKEIDPQIQRLILVCLEKDPARRPASALQVAAALPGGDPLAAALAAGETPSPDMVAAAGKSGALSPARAWTLMGGVAVVLSVAVAIAQHGLLVNLLPGDKSPAALTERAQEIAKSFGYGAPPADSAHWYHIDDDYWRYVSRVPSPERYYDLQNEYPGPLRFMYRQSPHPLVTTYPWHVNSQNPPPFYSGELVIGSDVQGRLAYFSAIATTQGGTPPNVPIDWSSFLREAGLDPAKAHPIQISGYPDVAVDQQIAWDVERDGRSIQVHAGAYGNRPVFFEVRTPWTHLGRVDSYHRPLTQKFGLWIFVCLAIGIDLFCVFLARKNVRLGRGDKKGGLRVALFLFAVQFTWTALSSHYNSDILWTWGWWNAMVGLSAGIGLQFWILYIALEPYVRRSWPEVLISWSRFMDGQFRDALVGRDVLLGVLFGVLMYTAANLHVALPHWFALEGVTPLFAGSQPLEDGWTFVGQLVYLLIGALMNSIGGLTALVILRKLIRNKSVAILLFALMGVFMTLVGENLPVELVSRVLYSVLAVFCLVRIGLLSYVFAFLTMTWFVYSPVTWDISRWYAGRGAATVFVVLAMALYGSYTSLGGRPVLGVAFED